MNILITGASGFVGQYLVDFFLRKKFNISSLGRSEVSDVKNYTLPKNWNKNDLVNIILEAKPDYLFHLAGSSQSDSFSESFNINTCFGSDLLDALSISGFNKKTRCLFFGSAAEYGMVKDVDLPLSEDICCKPYTYYGISKLAQTHYVGAWGKPGGKIVVIRPFTILGKYMPEQMAVGSFVKQIKEISREGGKGVLYTGNIDISRDFVDVFDVVEICWKLVNLDKASGQVINICSGRPLSLKAIIDYMVNLTGVDVSIEVEERRFVQVDIKTHYGDNSKLLDLLGKFKFIPWKESVKRMLGVL
jgi:GDP-4-dehydro-6-deoxy-D-mannose reductase